MRFVIAVVALGVAAPLLAQEPASANERQRAARYVAADYTVSSFHGDIDAWHLASISLGNRGPRGSFIGRVNLANRFAENGAQLEVDAYPRLGKHMYAFVNAGYSNDVVFPEWRSGAELFVNLPHAWEASVGYRQLRFGGPPVTLVTGAIGKYVGNSWVSVRPYLRSKSGELSASVGVTARQYFADADNFIGARASAGTSPSDLVDPSSIARTSSFAAAVQGSKTLTSRLVGTWSVGLEHEKLSAVVTRKRVDLSVGLRREL